MASELGVQTIQHTNGTDALTIDASGNVTMAQLLKSSSQPLVFARSENQGPITSANVMIWNIEDIDRGGNFASNVFTAPADGIYMVNTNVLYDNDTLATVHLQMQIDTGAGYSQYAQAYTNKPSGAYTSLTLTTFANLNTGDKVRIYNENGQIYGGGGKYHQLCIYMIP